jgi:hypothetical protein
MSISVLVVDSAGRKRGQSNALAFYCHEVKTYFYDGHRLAELPNWDLDELTPTHVSLVLLHNSDKEKWENLNCSADTIIRYTGGSPPIHSQEHEIWIRERSITSSEDAINQTEALEIIEWLTSNEQRYPSAQLPNILHPPRVVELLPALAILCQGYLAVHAEYNASNQGWGPPEIATALGLMGGNNLAHLTKSLSSDYRRDKAQTLSAPGWWLEVFGLWDAAKTSATQDAELWDQFERKLKDEWQEDKYGAIDDSLLNPDDPCNSMISSLRTNQTLSSPGLIARVYCALVKRLADKQYT